MSERSAATSSSSSLVLGARLDVDPSPSSLDKSADSSAVLAFFLLRSLSFCSNGEVISPYVGTCPEDRSIHPRFKM